jgi:hypothetical protein
MTVFDPKFFSFVCIFASFLCHTNFGLDLFFVIKNFGLDPDSGPDWIRIF